MFLLDDLLIKLPAKGMMSILRKLIRWRKPNLTMNHE